MPHDSPLSYAAFFHAFMLKTLVSPYFSAFCLAQLLKYVSKPYNKNLLTFWRIALIILYRLKRTTFAFEFQITGVQRWFMNRKRMFNRNVRKYNWQTTKKELGFYNKNLPIGVENYILPGMESEAVQNE